MAVRNAKVLVIGAGIVGLQTAINLLEAGIEVTIISEFWPGQKDIRYTSPWSGAHWRSNVHIDDIAQQKWNTATWHYWSDEVKKYSPDDSGLEMLPTTLYWDTENPESTDPEKMIWYSCLVPKFQMLPEDQLPPGAGIVAGASYLTFCLSPTRFLEHRLRICKNLGAELVTAKLESLEDAFKLDYCCDAVGAVNCTGIGACQLVPDENVFATKGQTIIVRGKAKRIGIRSGGKWENHVVPQPGSDTTLLSGCKLENDWSTETDKEINEWILERCKPLAPELLDENGCFEVLAEQVGHRPARKGGVRIDLEFLADRKKFICHHYGHGSSGYENSYGSVNDATKLVLEALNK